MILYQNITTPCVGVCSTGIGDSVCRGCNRFDYEVIHWNGYSEAEKAAIDNRLSSLLSGVMAKRFEIFDVDLLVAQLRVQQIPFAEYRNSYCWLHLLLRAGANQIDSTEEYGFLLKRASSDLSLSELLKIVDREFYALSIAHFERYIVANSRRANCVSSDEFVDQLVTESL